MKTNENTIDQNDRMTIIAIIILLSFVIILTWEVYNYSNEVKIECIKNNSSWLDVNDEDSHYTVCITNKATETLREVIEGLKKNENN